MKKLFIAMIAAMCCVTAAVLGASSVFGIMNEDGFAMPASAGVAQSLSGGGSAPVSLVKVQYDDAIYSSLTGYYVGEERQQIDMTYPLYTNGGAGLRFLNDDKWLVTANVDVYQTFDGLYLSDGVTYNEDMTQADDEEFIFTMLSNGLYINVQRAVFTNATGDTVIPGNSIIRMSEESICWFEQKNGTLGYHSEEAVFGATITIGDHTYNYTDLLDALGLTREAINHADHGTPDPEKLQEAEEILNGKSDHNGKRPGNTSGASLNEEELAPDTGNDLPTGGNQDADAAGGKQDPPKDNDGSQESGDHKSDPDQGKDLTREVEELKALVKAYRTGELKEKI